MGLKSKIKFFFIRKIVKFLIHIIIFTCKVEIEGLETLQKIKSKHEPVIFVFWHKKIFFTIYRFKKTGARPLISNSEDGELVSQIAEEFKMNPVRGSSSKGGAKAFIRMMNSIKENRSHILITADGPKGPAEMIKEGTIRLAEKTSAAVIPINWHSTKTKVFEKSWDRFELPLPFGKIRFKYGDPVYITKNADKDYIEHYKKVLKENINKLEENKLSKNIS